MSNIVELEKARGKTNLETDPSRNRPIFAVETGQTSSPIPETQTLKQVSKKTEVILAELRKIRKQVEQAEKERTLIETASKRKQSGQEKKEKATFSQTQKNPDYPEPIQSDSNDQKEASSDTPFNLIRNKLKELKFEETEPQSPDIITKENTPDPDQPKAA